MCMWLCRVTVKKGCVTFQCSLKQKIFCYITFERFWFLEATLVLGIILNKFNSLLSNNHFKQTKQKCLKLGIHNNFLWICYFLLCWLADIVRSDIALDKQNGCKVANHPDIMLELQREKAASTQLVLLKEQLSNIYSNITITGRRSHTHTRTPTNARKCALEHVFHIHITQSGLWVFSTFMHAHAQVRVHVHEMHACKVQSMPM